jgi:hypothetical protein
MGELLAKTDRPGLRADGALESNTPSQGSRTGACFEIIADEAAIS